MEDGRFSRPYGPGAHSRASQKTNLRSAAIPPFPFLEPETSLVRLLEAFERSNGAGVAGLSGGAPPDLGLLQPALMT
jgi:hypothetical protein